MNRLKIYSDKKCTKEIKLDKDKYILNQHTNTISRDVTFHMYIKNESKDIIDNLKVVNTTHNGVMVNDVKGTIKPNEVIEVNMAIHISQLESNEYFEVINVSFKPIGNGTYGDLSKVILEYLVGKTYSYVKTNDEHEDVKFKISIISPLKTYVLDVIFLTQYIKDIKF